MKTEKQVYRNLLNKLGEEAGKPFYFFKNELAVSELGFMVLDASLAFSEVFLQKMKLGSSGFNFSLRENRYLPICTELAEYSTPTPFVRLAPVLLYVFDKYILSRNMNLEFFYMAACQLVDPGFNPLEHSPWEKGINENQFSHLNPSLFSADDVRYMRPYE